MNEETAEQLLQDLNKSGARIEGIGDLFTVGAGFRIWE
jgi:hypothetical protein